MAITNETTNRYNQEAAEVVRCMRCGSMNIGWHTDESADGLSIDDEYMFCYDCERKTDADIETIEEWAERVNINLNES